MKKLESEAWLTILTGFLSILLILNICLQNQENVCNSRVDKMIDDRELKIYYNILQSVELTTLEKDINFSGETINNKSQIVGKIEPDMQDTFSSFFNLSAQTQKEINILNDEIYEQRKECDNLSSLGDISLYAALVLNIIILVISIRKKVTKLSDMDES